MIKFFTVWILLRGIRTAEWQNLEKPDQHQEGSSWHKDESIHKADPKPAFVHVGMLWLCKASI